MGWTAGSDVTTGDLITAATWNDYLGAAGSLEYLKTEADKLDDVSQTDVSGSRAVDTIYRNTSGKIRVVVVTVTVGDGEQCRMLCDGSTPPTLVVGDIDNDTGGTITVTLATVVEVNDYYEVEQTVGTTPFVSWTEYDMH